MRAEMIRSTVLVALATGATVFVGNGIANATSGGTAMTDGTSTIAQLSSPATSAEDVQDITITGTGTDAGTGDPVGGGAGTALDGEYVIAAGGTRTTAVLGAVAFDPSGAITAGSITFIAAGAAPTGTAATTTRATARATATPTTDAGAAAGASIGGGGGGLAAPSGNAASVTECAVTEGSYVLTETGAGEAQLQLDCAGIGAQAVTWKLFVTVGDGFSLTEQVRAVQLEPLPGTIDNEIVDLTLTLR